MSKQVVSSFLLLLVISVSFTLLFIPTQENGVDQGTEISKLRFRWDTDPLTTVVIMFESSIWSSGECEYGLTSSLGSQVNEEGCFILHEIRLAGIGFSIWLLFSLLALIHLKIKRT